MMFKHFHLFKLGLSGLAEAWESTLNHRTTIIIMISSSISVSIVLPILSNKPLCRATILRCQDVSAYYPIISISIHRYPQVSISIHRLSKDYPQVSIGIHRYPQVIHRSSRSIYLSIDLQILHHVFISPFPSQVTKVKQGLQLRADLPLMPFYHWPMRRIPGRVPGIPSDPM